MTSDERRRQTRHNVIVGFIGLCFLLVAIVTVLWSLALWSPV